jgi:hypothetical protein
MMLYDAADDARALHETNLDRALELVNLDLAKELEYIESVEITDEKSWGRVQSAKRRLQTVLNMQACLQAYRTNADHEREMYEAMLHSTERERDHAQRAATDWRKQCEYWKERAQSELSFSMDLTGSFLAQFANHSGRPLPTYLYLKAEKLPPFVERWARKNGYLPPENQSDAA